MFIEAEKALAGWPQFLGWAQSLTWRESESETRVEAEGINFLL